MIKLLYSTTVLFTSSLILLITALVDIASILWLWRDLPTFFIAAGLLCGLITGTLGAGIGYVWGGLRALEKALEKR